MKKANAHRKQWSPTERCVRDDNSQPALNLLQTQSLDLRVGAFYVCLYSFGADVFAFVNLCFGRFTAFLCAELETLVSDPRPLGHLL